MPQELPVQRHAEQRRGVGGDVLDRGHIQGQRPEPAQVRAVASEEMPNATDLGDSAYPDSLMPWSESVPTEIRLKPKAAEEAAKIAGYRTKSRRQLTFPQKKG